MDKKASVELIALAVVLIVGIVGAGMLFVPAKTGMALMPQCTDSDGGKNFNEQGSTTLLDHNLKLAQVSDSCALDSLGKKLASKGPYVKEGYCSPKGIGFSMVYACPNQCINGACVQASTPAPAPAVNVTPAPEVSETVTCQYGGTAIVSCSSIKGGCGSSSGSCSVVITGKKGEVVNWDVSCRTYGGTTASKTSTVLSGAPKIIPVSCAAAYGPK